MRLPYGQKFSDKIVHATSTYGAHMCGILGFALKKPTAMENVLTLLENLEAHQYPDEPKPVGGYGAGIAVLRGNAEDQAR